MIKGKTFKGTTSQIKNKLEKYLNDNIIECVEKWHIVESLTHCINSIYRYDLNEYNYSLYGASCLLRFSEYEDKNRNTKYVLTISDITMNDIVIYDNKSVLIDTIPYNNNAYEYINNKYLIDKITVRIKCDNFEYSNNMSYKFFLGVL